MQWVVLCFLCNVPVIHGNFQQYRVDGFFGDSSLGVINMFKWAMKEMNMDSTIHPGMPIANFKTQLLPNDDAFEAGKQVCEAIQNGSRVIFGPFDRAAADHVQSIGRGLQIPVLQAHWDPRDLMTNSFSRDRIPAHVNLYPSVGNLSQGYREIISHFRWKNLTLLYEDEDGLIRAQEILKLEPETRVYLRKMEAHPEMMYNMFTDMKDKEEYRVVLDCKTSSIVPILQKALQCNALTENFHYFLTNLDLHMVDLELFKYSGANITGVSLIDINSRAVAEVKSKLSSSFPDNRDQYSPFYNAPQKISTQLAFVYDSVRLLREALNGTLASRRQLNFTQAVSCSRATPWEDGRDFYDFIKSSTVFDGLTGKVQLGNFGERDVFRLNIYQLSRSNLKHIGYWEPPSTAQMQLIPRNETRHRGPETYKLVVVMVEPYVIYKDGKYEGFCIDIMDAIAERLNFRYEVIQSPKNEYGNCDELSNGSVTCTGMVKMLVERQVDMAITGFTITHARAKYIDFTKPFMNLGITVLFRKPKPDPPELMSFLAPLDNTVWAGIITVFLGISLVLLLTARFTPYEWINPHPCDPTTEEVENQFSPLSSLWYVIAALMQQGCELAPVAVSTRTLAASWWFFTLILISSYTANLAAFLTVENVVSPIESAEDLASQTVIKFGTTQGGSTMDFFRNSSNPTYVKMYNIMERASPPVWADIVEGERRVLGGDYAYLSESSSIEYRVERNCDLMQVGNWLDSKGYGIGLPKDSDLTDDVSREIIKLKEEQIIQSMYDKWWKQKKDVDCSGGKTQTTNPLTMQNVGGIFLVLIGGTFVGLLVAFGEFLWIARQNARKYKSRWRSEICKEFRFEWKCGHGFHKSTENGLQNIPLTKSYIKANGGQDITYDRNIQDDVT
uniref:Glutamate receptor ionotropic, kainate 2-like n=1 Tax=Crassostrea virginica TaxID=6565 RepID=A0A8B8AY35_CRAVI|nr:glutamate receptor ionotropic, kainate 2-like [Crassostrea virginica]